MKREDFSIMENVKTIENLKSQLLYVIADFFSLMTKGSNVAKDAMLQCISSGIIIFYTLADKLGYSYVTIDESMKKNLKAGISENDKLEKNDKSLSRLYSHISDRN